MAVKRDRFVPLMAAGSIFSTDTSSWRSASSPLSPTPSMYPTRARAGNLTATEERYMPDAPYSRCGLM